jgi:hypothetical protein
MRFSSASTKAGLLLMEAFRVLSVTAATRATTAATAATPMMSPLEVDAEVLVLVADWYVESVPPDMHVPELETVVPPAELPTPWPPVQPPPLHAQLARSQELTDKNAEHGTEHDPDRSANPTCRFTRSNSTYM